MDPARGLGPAIAALLAALVVGGAMLHLYARARSASADMECPGEEAVRAYVEATLLDTYPYADDPALRDEEVRVKSSKRDPKDRSCIVTYEVGGEGRVHSRRYAFDPGSAEASRVSLPYGAMRWCQDLRCRGHVS